MGWLASSYDMDSQIPSKVRNLVCTLTFLRVKRGMMELNIYKQWQGDGQWLMNSTERFWKCTHWSNNIGNIISCPIWLIDVNFFLD